jgi:hypothetical protein
MKCPAPDSNLIDSAAVAVSLARMASIHVNELIQELQVAIGPVILISGVGLVLLSLTNRFGRAVDRSRQLGREMRGVSEAADRARLAAQVEVLYRRASLIQVAIVMAALSLLFVAGLIICLFVSILMKLEVGLMIALLFIACMVCLIVSLIAFMRDIQLSLQALKLELGVEE